MEEVGVLPKDTVTTLLPVPVEELPGLEDTLPMGVKVGVAEGEDAPERVPRLLPVGAMGELEGEGLQKDVRDMAALTEEVPVPTTPVKVTPADPDTQALAVGLALPDPPTLLPLPIWEGEGVLELLALPVPEPSAPLPVGEAEAIALVEKKALTEGVNVFPASEGEDPPLTVPLPDPADVAVTPFKEGDIEAEGQPLPPTLIDTLAVSVPVGAKVKEPKGVPVPALGVRLGHTVVKGEREGMGEVLTPKLGVEGRLAIEEGVDAALPVPPPPCEPEALELGKGVAVEGVDAAGELEVLSHALPRTTPTLGVERGGVIEEEGVKSSVAEANNDIEPLTDCDGDCEGMALCVPPPAPAARLFELITLEVGLESLETVGPKLNETPPELLPAGDSVALAHPVPLTTVGVRGADGVPARFVAEPMEDVERVLKKMGDGVTEAVPVSDCDEEVVVMDDNEPPLLEEAVEDGEIVTPALKVPPAPAVTLAELEGVSDMVPTT